MTHRLAEERHLELVEVQPSLRVVRVQVVEGVPGQEAEGVELTLGREEQRGGGLLVVQARVSPCNRQTMEEDELHRVATSARNVMSSREDTREPTQANSIKKPLISTNIDSLSHNKKFDF